MRSLLLRHAICAETTLQQNSLTIQCASLTFLSLSFLIIVQKDRSLTSFKNLLICLYRGLAVSEICSISRFKSRKSSLRPLLSSNSNRGKPCLKTRSLEHISRMLAAAESFIKALTGTFNSNMRGTSNNDTLLFFRRTTCWSQRRDF